ncbi:UNVERIFIED_CONTAM: hypothetical protein K2H54_020847 [Gekko kuhli]
MLQDAPSRHSSQAFSALIPPNFLDEYTLNWKCFETISATASSHKKYLFSESTESQFSGGSFGESQGFENQFTFVDRYAGKFPREVGNDTLELFFPHVTIM